MQDTMRRAASAAFAAALFLPPLAAQGEAARTERRTVRFERLVVPVTPPPRERALAELPLPLLVWIERLCDRSAKQRAAARRVLSASDWRYVEAMRKLARSSLEAERRRALAYVVQRLLDRKYNGEAARTARGTPRRLRTAASPERARAQRGGVTRARTGGGALQTRESNRR